MKKAFFVFVLIFIFILFQSTFYPLFSFPINLSLIFIFFTSFFLPSNQAIFPYLLGGFILDTFSEKFFSFYIFVCLIIFFFYLLIKKYVKV